MEPVVGKYVVGKSLGEADGFCLYECRLPDNSVGILKLATDAIGDGLLDREAVILRTMAEEAARLERAFAATKRDSNEYLNYDLCFPSLVESFTAPEQGGRRVNVVNFRAVTNDLGRLIPLEHFRSRAHVRIDPRTSAWIMGKLLKILGFAHNQGITVGQVTGDNVLIEQDEHYVLIFDWTQASEHQDSVPSELAREEISCAAREVILALGGNPETGELPNNPALESNLYADHLHCLATGKARDAIFAHREFYELIRSLWPREFHPFTTYPIERSK